MKKTLFIFASFIAALFALAPLLLNFSLTRLPQALQVSAAMGAKLACSAHFISQYSPEQIKADLSSYSPANDLLNIEYNDPIVTASFLGLTTESATYQHGIGCHLNKGVSPLTDIHLAPLATQPQNNWPAGENIPHIAPQLQTYLTEQVTRDNQANLNTRALVVIHNGQLVAEDYAQGVTAKTPLLGWSMAKSVTAILQGSSEYLGLINDTDQSLFKAWQADERQHIQLKQLLTMTSGLAFNESYTPGTDATEMLFNRHRASDVPLANAQALPRGSHFHYSSGTTNLINLALYQAWGGNSQAQYDFIQQTLFKPLNMHHSVFESDSSGVIVGSSYLYASARDWARLGLLLLNKGEINNKRLLNENWVNKATSPNNSNNDTRYGYQLWLNKGRNNEDLRWPSLPEDAYAMLGNRKQIVMVIPSANTVLVRLGWTKGHYPTDENFAALLKQAQASGI